MRIYPPAIAAHLAARKPLLVRTLLWITARERTPERTPQSLGLWNGADHQSIVVGGETRTYYGVGGMLGLEALVSSMALEVRQYQIELSPLHAQVIEAIWTYDARLAPVELHSWYLDPETHLPLAAPIREFRGTVMEVDAPEPPVGGTASCVLTLASDAWRLTRGLTTRRSDAALKARSPGDALRKYNVVTGVEVAWGERLAVDPGSSGQNGGGSVAPAPLGGGSASLGGLP